MKRRTKVLMLLGAFALAFSFIGYGVFASPVETPSANMLALTTDEDGNYSIEDMLNYAIIDEYTAKATYEAILQAYGDIKPFTNIVLAEQTHIDLLLPLFETYGIDVPVNDVIVTTVPDSIASALQTGVVAEQENIAIYETFLSQDLPNDVEAVFEYLKTASENHLASFSRDRYFGAGYDIANGIKNQWRKMFNGSNGASGSNGRNGRTNQSNQQGGFGSGDCNN